MTRPRERIAAILATVEREYRPGPVFPAWRFPIHDLAEAREGDLDGVLKDLRQCCEAGYFQQPVWENALHLTIHGLSWQGEAALEAHRRRQQWRRWLRMPGRTPSLAVRRFIRAHPLLTAIGSFCSVAALALFVAQVAGCLGPP